MRWTIHAAVAASVRFRSFLGGCFYDKKHHETLGRLSPNDIHLPPEMRTAEDLQEQHLNNLQFLETLLISAINSGRLDRQAECNWLWKACSECFCQATVTAKLRNHVRLPAHRWVNHGKLRALIMASSDVNLETKRPVHS